MARDNGLEQVIEDHLGEMPGLVTKSMFGGLAWMLDGHLLIAASHEGMMARLGKGNDEWALAIAGVKPMVMQNRVMAGWVRIDSETCADDTLRARLIDGAVAFVRTLPPKP